MIMNGAHALLPGLGLLDRASGRVLPAVITAGLAMAGIVWQMSNIMKWLVAMGLIDHLPKDGADRSKA
jgi:hypothetical protein